MTTRPVTSRLLRTRWRSGPVPLALCPVVVSVTDFTAASHPQAGVIALAGLRLRRTWSRTPGALGMWLWAEVAGRRSGSVSVWRDAAALEAFVGRPDHIAVVRAHRGRGTMRAAAWEAEDFDPDAVWGRARALLAGTTPWPQGPVRLEDA
ncbi:MULTISPECIES: hypothetical protein [unclassified Streptomyces]|uniref:hypothetical protein n=1 Tax=unclassified Streptomyces TaxID=2593676 RepID=UPI001F51EE2C|nr:hypothetical protein [Streptomyces sp. CB02058]